MGTGLVCGLTAMDNVVSCLGVSVSVVVSGFSYSAQSLRCLLRGWCVLDFSVDLLHYVRAC